MNEVRCAKTAGFCFGVSRAVNQVYEQAKEHLPVYTYGSIIHNEQVVADLEKKGVCVIDDAEEFANLPKGVIIIRSHGVTKEQQEKLTGFDHQLIDCTCPFVKKIHDIVNEHSRAGEQIVVIGNAFHPEVQGISGWSVTPVIIIENKEDINDISDNKETAKLLSDKKVCIVSQTTFNYKKFEELVEILSKKGYDILAMNTICNATEERQREAKELAAWSDAMVVVGGKHSSNTQKLYEICKHECDSTYYIQTLDDLDLEQFKSFRSVGITAGASTPKKIIEEVQTACQKRVLNNY